ncbi:ammecr1 family protein [Boeremia exigua]|uniref:ammecr1 family protein n=1 Tax=Boeremia exigua TaxID=749465 RepID=UPI001E8EC0C4|nr:ammecr1 family protein [Boeremia exigua]KAH6637538.1 ammecr1 family protein [Boeremia exigua]
MATDAHCAYCFESLAASLEKRPALSLRQVEALWKKYSASATTTDVAEADTDSPAKPAAISRLLSPSSGSASSAASTPSGTSSASSAGTSMTSLGSALQKEESAQGEYPLFVTWNTLSRSGDKRLRGCIGTFEPLDLEEGLSSYALTSAFDDGRFSPVTARELPSLQAAVTLLTNFEPTPNNDPLAWDIGTHGLRISFTYHGRRYGSTYLPDVAREQGWTKEEALVSLMRKAGWSGRKDDWQKIGLKVIRYQGKKAALDYEEWKAWREWVDEEMADK